MKFSRSTLVRGIGIFCWVVLSGTIAYSQHKEKEEYTVTKARSVLQDYYHTHIHDDSFLDLYTSYLSEQKRTFRCSFLMLNNLARAAEYISEKEAFDCINTFLSMQQESNRVQSSYFRKILKEVGYQTAIEFIKIEAAREEGVLPPSTAAFNSSSGF